ncbi:hypothetical protein QOT17_020663 [Balamuthia mandrillaris]
MNVSKNRGDDEEIRVDVDTGPEKKEETQAKEATYGLAASLVLVSLYVGLWTAEGLIIYSARDVDFDRASVTLAVEIFKMVVASSLYFSHGGSVEQFKQYFGRASIFAVPALVYTLYNLVRYFALTIADPGTYRVLINARIAFSGILFQIFFHKQLGQRKWIALVALTLGCAIMKWGEPLQLAATPLLVIGFQALLGSLGGVYNEVALKRDMKLDINLQNMYLYIFTISLNIATIFVKTLFRPDSGFLFRNWSLSVMGPMVLLGGGGGFMTALLLKHLNVLIKEFANGAEMLLSALFSNILFGVPLNAQVFAAIFVVSGSVIMYYWERIQPSLQANASSSSSSSSTK